MAREKFTKAPGSKGVKPTTGGTSAPYLPAKGCAAKRKNFKTGVDY